LRPAASKLAVGLLSLRRRRRYPWAVPHAP
jgi:hypothetical protein